MAANILSVTGISTANHLYKALAGGEKGISLSLWTAYIAELIKNLLSYVFPVTLMVMATTTMLLFKGLKEQGRVGRYFGKVTIRDQPPSNTIQKIIAYKEAMADLENFLQNINVSLLKIRTIVLAGQPQITTEVALVLLGSAIVLRVVPFKYVLAFGLLDLFTRELGFRREMAIKFMNFLRERWASAHAAPVVLPYVSEAGSEGTPPKERLAEPTPKSRQRNRTALDS